MPGDFAIAPDVAFIKEKFSVPKPHNVTTTIIGNLNEAIAQEKCLLMMLIEKKVIEVEGVIAWSA